MIELPDDFRDVLIELADASADFVVLGGHAVAFHGHVRATKALAAFGAPLEAFDVAEADFATYDGTLQMGVLRFASTS